MNLPGPKNKMRWRAFTLVELLVVITLMGILSGMMAYAMSGARQEAREKRARAEIAAINAVLMQKMNEINLSPVLLIPADETNGTLAFTANPTVRSGAELNRVTMLARRDLNRMVLPECRADLIYPTARLQYRKIVSGGFQPCAVKIKEPPEWGAMRRLAGFIFPRGTDVEGAAATGYAAIPASNRVMGVAIQDSIDGAAGYFNYPLLRQRLGAMNSSGTPVNIDLTTEPWGADLSADGLSPWTRNYESAECLYLILASTELYGERALDQFSARMITNLDNDAVPELSDPWGVPYEFIRDATGLGYPFFGASDPVTGTPASPHPNGADASDYLRTDLRLQAANPAGENDDTYRVTPVVVSAGIDGEFGMRRSFDPNKSFADGYAGVSPRYSMSIVRYTGAGPFVPQPALANGTYQYPDPYIGVSGTADPGTSSTGSDFIAGAAVVSNSTQAAWYQGIGLGATIYTSGRPLDAAGDDIYSTAGRR